MKKRWFTLAALVTAVLIVAGVAAAQESAGDDGIESHTEYGALWAKGEGIAELRPGKAAIRMLVSGDVTITGPSDLDVIINDAPLRRTESGSTNIEMEDFEGKIKVRGRDYVVIVDGRVALHGRGYGEASFQGQGWWKTLHKRGLWSAGEPETDIQF